MVAEKFPISQGTYLGLVELNYILEHLDTHCYMFRVRIWDLEAIRDCDHPISISKCRQEVLEEPLIDNGRLFMAAYLETTCTEQDLLTYQEFYTWSKIEIFDCYEYVKQYLPRPFVLAILKLYKDKTELKDVAGKELEYQISKAMLNAAFGMTVTDIVREELYYDETKPKPFYSNYDNMTKEEYLEYLDTQIKRYNSNPYRFLFYAWGIWVTAYARRNLFSGIKECSDDYIYSDTDSLKIKHRESHLEYFKKYNENIVRKLKEACEFHEIDFSLTKPKNIKGVEKQLGIWDYEGEYDEFMTLGAKRYMYRKGNNWTLTVAGVNKKMGMQYLLMRAQRWNCSPTATKVYTPFSFFNIDLTFPAEHSGRTVLTYIDEEKKGEIEDYTGIVYPFAEESGIHMESTEYSMNPMKEFLNYLFSIKEESW